ILSTASSNGFTKPSPAQQILQNQLVLDLKAYGIWSKLDVLHIFANDADINYSLINWINRVVGSHSGTIVKTLNSHVNQGLGSDYGISTGYNPYYNGDNFTLNSVSIGYKTKWSNDISTNDGILMGSANNITPSINSTFLYDIGYGRFWLNNTTQSQFSGANEISKTVNPNFIHLTRNGDECKVYKNAILQATKSNPAEGLTNFNFRYLQQSQGTQIQSGYIGGFLTADEISDFQDLIDQYLIDITL